jgi:hypothetical protein
VEVRSLSGISRYLSDRLSEELNKLLLVARLDSEWMKQVRLLTIVTALNHVSII